jgi:hypothetical protein
MVSKIDLVTPHDRAERLSLSGRNEVLRKGDLPRHDHVA